MDPAHDPVTATHEATAGDRDRSVLLEISNEMVRLYKEQFGRGPTAARTAWAGRDVLVVVLEDTLTPAERSLVRIGEHQRLRETRMVFQHASLREFCEPVERLTGRRVRAFTSATDTLVDGLSVETFVLHPEGSDAPSRIELGDRDELD
ncbi:Na-translocating system protein MpsC family protein [Conexibacter sp. SYSU D00693]|uniref:Na-translocating system protein MpsC family protein n=1 Tax=Conexibacter sp. SYSU D00693 TaxID=2812560 RepID=UPI00196B74BA|nr:Na-translocating system protein MpsC family protein [Conexibacter sp. SYSU D00693]